ncbi:uroporphyrinogen-III C-methyltransferase [Marinoscillum sp. MHG1-6]|uniref:uroporphyrinogen-III C-methyltransferase n=1 Tax=Marinoscillum sp. MHG1-6 TaxID=2959627 RepID=UPI002157D554|nr:uroporphyrinogen-III C-methyltransferase [Marinoscillum sp. MHG1-6]
MAEKARLTLVGAGPGDPELITLKGVKALKAADVVLYDALVHPDMLEHAQGAELIFVGKRAGKYSVTQKEINELIVEHALKGDGQHIVRLKGGDPFVFARGLEEIAYAEQYGITGSVVIGISSIMLPGYYGIPLTSRGINQSFTAVTATTAEGGLSEEVVNAAKNSPSTVFFMGSRKLDLIVAEYQKAGRGDLPVAVISNGSLETGSYFKGTVDTIVGLFNEKQPEPPILLIFGHGAAHAHAVQSYKE